MIQQTDLTGKFALDAKGVADLHQAAVAGSPAALKSAATQFEAMFINMMMKSMRAATPQDGMMDNEQTKMFTTMLDQQTSQQLAKKGLGLSEMLIRQLSKTPDPKALALSDDGSSPSAGASGTLDALRLQKAIAAVGGNGANGGNGGSGSNGGSAGAGKAAQPTHVRNFQEKLGADAEAASKSTGIPAKFMLGQAALESGWGKREIKGRDGKTSHNLFGIKAGADWKGKVVEATTTEYVNGKAQSRVERFRAYDSYSDSFKDYANLLASNPRYQKVLASGGDASSFAHGLQQAGYATDPLYAAKLTNIIKHSLV